MTALIIWTLIYSIVVAASIIFIGRPLEGSLTVQALAKLMLDVGFLFGLVLAFGARFMFVIINKTASEIPSLSKASLTVAALATMCSVIAIIIANYIFLGEQLKNVQFIGVALILAGIFFVFK